MTGVPEPVDAPSVAQHSNRDVGRLRRRIGWVMIGVGLVIVAAGAYLAVTALKARSELNAVRDGVHQLRAQISAGRLDAADATAKALAKHAANAHDLTTGPIWAAAASLPAGGEALESARGIASSADTLARAVLPALLRTKEELSSLRGTDGAVDLGRVRSLAPLIARADEAVQSSVGRLRGLPGDTWIDAVDAARTDLLTQLVSLQGSVHSADLALRVAPTMLGADSVQRYIVVFQNSAEARGTGGLPGSFGLLAADRGTLTFERFESDDFLKNVDSGLDLGAQYDLLYGSGHPTSQYINSNLSPTFSYAARIWTAMWERKTGQRLDGAFALDPTALSYLLAVTGPASLPDGSQVDASDVVDLTQRDAYARFPDPAKRKEFLKDVARAASRRVLDAGGSLTELLKAAGHAAGERRLLIWSRSSSVEEVLDQTPLAGALTPRTTGMFLVNDGGNKLDYYLDRSVDVVSQGCGAVRETTVTIRLTNTAPAAGLPRYVTSRTEGRSYPIKRGDNRELVHWVGLPGTDLTSASVDGRSAPVTVGEENGHPVFVIDTEVPRGRTTTVALNLSGPSLKGSVQLRQPLVRPITIGTKVRPC